MNDEVKYHRSLSRNPRSPAVKVHMLYHGSDGSPHIQKEQGHWYWKADQRFVDYATLWEKRERRFFPHPVVDSFGTIIGYWGWVNASTIAVPVNAPTTLKWTAYEDREEREYQTDLRLDDIVNNFHIDRTGGGHKLGGPYPVFVSITAPRTPEGSRWAGNAPEKYNIIVDIEGRVVAATDYDIGGTRSPSSASNPAADDRESRF